MTKTSKCCNAKTREQTPDKIGCGLERTFPHVCTNCERFCETNNNKTTKQEAEDLNLAQQKISQVCNMLAEEKAQVIDQFLIAFKLQKDVDFEKIRLIQWTEREGMNMKNYTRFESIPEPMSLEEIEKEFYEKFCYYDTMQQFYRLDLPYPDEYENLLDFIKESFPKHNQHLQQENEELKKKLNLIKNYIDDFDTGREGSHQYEILNPLMDELKQLLQDN